ncbi:MAG: response regulator [Chitinophagaceae bacterium]|nr:response regulator [Chitinophagaceae bacterium]
MKLLKKIINIGVDDTLPEFEVRRIRLANILTLSPLVVYALFAFIGLKYNIPEVVWITIVVSIINLSGLGLSNIKKYTLARTVPLVFNSVLIFFVSDIFDFGRPFYLFYFPIITAYGSYYRFKNERSNVVAAFSITAASVLLCIFLPVHSIYRITTSETLVTGIGLLVKVLSFLLFILFIAMLINFNLSVENLLRKAIEKANEQAYDLKAANAKAEEAAAAKSRFLSNMSHELRTPLNGIIGSVNLLMDTHSPQEEKQNLAILKYSSEHMLSLVNDVLDFSKIEAGKMELKADTCNLKTLCAETAASFEQQFKEKGLLFEYKTDEALNRSYITDTTRLKQVLMNLISNACKFTHNGKVTFTVRQTLVSASSTGVLFTVTDTGIGIDPEMHHRIFENFSQIDTSASRKHGGTGLGLSISSKIVEMMGGVLQLTSEPCKGSSFSFTLHLQPDNVQKPFIKDRKDTELLPLDNLRVLLAEDNPVNMMIAKKFLTKWNVTLTTAVNGSEVIEHFNSMDFDVLLIDLEMPGIDGYKAVEHIRLINKKIPAIAFTAAVFDNINQHLLEKGFSGYLQKPFRPEDLHRKIAMYHTAL